MNRVMPILVLFFSISLYCAGASAETLIRDTNYASRAFEKCLALAESKSMPFATVTLSDGTLVVCGRGAKELEIRPQDEQKENYGAWLPNSQSCSENVQNLSKTLKSAGLSDVSTIHILMQTLASRLDSLEEAGQYQDEISDTLFSQIAALMVNLDWIKHEGWYITGSSGSTELSWLATLGRSKHYRIKGISLLSGLLVSKTMTRFDRRYGKTSLMHVVEDLLFDSKDHWPAEARPTDAEKKNLAGTLLWLLKDDPSLFPYFTLSDEMRTSLASVAPDLLSDIEQVSEVNKIQEELDETSKTLEK